MYQFLGLKLKDIDSKVMKVRIANTDTNKGKSNGYRLIYYAVKTDYTVYLLSIYYKKDDRRVLSDSEIRELAIKYL